MKQEAHYNLFNCHSMFVVLWIIIILVFSSCDLQENGKEGDWPMWRHDARHSAFTPEDLPFDLHLQWQRKFYAPDPAFPNNIRMNFDQSYEPVASEHTLYIPSMVTGSVTAFDTRTGKKKWEFYSDGPVRYAPIVWRGRVYFASDDGYLYCLKAANGQLNWKFWVPPEEKKPYKLLGNSRLISRWPVRGGPVLKEGVIYLGSGIWPSDGVYVCAVDARSGELIWKNDKLSNIQKGLVDHSARRDVGLAPLGYLTVVGDKLIVPMGRALPAIFSIRTGNMEPYSTGWGGRGGLARGSWWVCGTEDYYFTNGELYGLGDQEVPELSNNHLTPSEFAQSSSLSLQKIRNWMQNGKLPVIEKNDKELIEIELEKSYLTFSSLKNHEEAEKHAIKRYPRLQISKSNKYNQCEFRKPVVTPNSIFYSVPTQNDSIGRRLPDVPNGARNINTELKKVSFDKIQAYDISADPDWGLTATQNSPDDKVSLWKTLRFDRMWELSSDLRIHLKAGNRLYGGSKGVVAAVDFKKEPEVIWQKEIEGTPSTMLAADNRLFVVTWEGMLYCFGSERTQVSEYTLDKESLEYSRKNIKTRTDKILSHAKGKKGYCLVLGLPESEVIREIYRQTGLNTVVLESDREKVRKARHEYEKYGIYGTRVQIVTGDLSSLQLPPYIANLVISLNPGKNNFVEENKFVKQLTSLLRPYSGRACLSLSDSQYQSLKNKLKQSDRQDFQVKRTDEFVLLNRLNAPEGSAPWTHEAGTPGNTFSNRDQTIKPPMGVSWFGGPVDDSIFSRLTWDYTHSRPPRPLVCDGRMFFIIHDELHAIDIYTGSPLWKTSLPHSSKTKDRRQEHFTGRRNTADNFIATTDMLYVFRESSCLKLDPETGNIIGELTTPEVLESRINKESAKWNEARIWEDKLLVNIEEFLVCMNRYSGNLQWRVQTEKDWFNFAVGDGKVFAADYWKKTWRNENRTSEIQAFDIDSGKLLWNTSARLPEEGSSGWLQYKVHPIPPYLSYSEKHNVVLLSGTYNVMSGYSGEDGKTLWEKPDAIKISRGMPPSVLGDRFITRSGKVYDLLTGDSTRTPLWSGLRGCNRPVGNQESVLVRDGLPTIRQFSEGSQTSFMARSGCTNNLIPGDGVLTVLNFATGCACNYPVFTSFGAVYMP